MKHLLPLLLLLFALSVNLPAVAPDEFLAPPETARPWGYWFIMDGNLTREGITADLEAMKEQKHTGDRSQEKGVEK